MIHVHDVIRLIATGQLKGLEDVIWFSRLGLGYYPVKREHADGMYVDSYFDKFEHYETTAMGQEITQRRIEFVDDIYDGTVIDIGIGSGHFIKERPNTLGYDVSDYGLRFLNERGIYCNPYSTDTVAITCWDSFEHIDYAWQMIKSVQKYVFMSIPIFNGQEEVLGSRHFKPKEHYWYFSRSGIITCFGQMGFKMIANDCFETTCGREGIGTYAFERV